MDISSAIEQLGIEDIFSETPDSLKKKYRLLMKKHHPDVNGGDTSKSVEISSAYNLLKDELPKLLAFSLVEAKEDRQHINIGVTLDSILKIYNGEHLKVKDITLTESSIHAYNVIILESVEITHNNVTKSFVESEPLSLVREYTVHSNIKVQELNKPESVTIKVLDRTFTIDVKGVSLKIPFRFGDMTVNVIINKKLES